MCSQAYTLVPVDINIVAVARLGRKEWGGGGGWMSRGRRRDGRMQGKEHMESCG